MQTLRICCQINMFTCIAMLQKKWFNSRSFFAICCFCLMTLVIMIIYSNHLSSVFFITISQNGSQNPEKKQGLLIDTPGCKIPELDPMDSTIIHLINKPNPLKCPGPPPLVVVNKAKFSLSIDTKALKKHYGGQLSYCRYQAFYRNLYENSDKVFKFNMSVIKFDLNEPHVFVKDEFIRVDCYNKNKTNIYFNFHAFLISKPLVSKQLAENFHQCEECQQNKERFNLLVFGMDSTSRSNFLRMCPKTYKYITETMNAIDFKGYNKVADNTFVNIVPFLTGKYVEELPWNETLNHLPFDNYTFLWNNFTKQGFHTLMAEDESEVSIFTYLKEGFHKQPTDYYLRPFNLVVEKSSILTSGKGHCLRKQTEPEVILDWTHDFMKLYKTSGFFAFLFLSRMSHDYLNDASLADEPYYEFFQSIHESGVLKNTIVIFMSDHGLRFGDIRKTYIGKLEERLPFLFWILPPSFKAKYPTIFKNLQINSERLTTPFDMFETFLDILHFRNTTRSNVIVQRGYSLFSEVPATRTCKDAQILPHWCTCQEYKKVSSNSFRVIHASNFVVKSLNYLIEAYATKCHTWTLNKIHDARLSEPSETILKFEKSLNDVIDRKVYFGSRASSIINYFLTIVADPGQAWFEATVQYSEVSRKYKLLGDISRISLYGHQADCILEHRLRKFCVCKT